MSRHGSLRKVVLFRFGFPTRHHHVRAGEDVADLTRHITDGDLAWRGFCTQDQCAVNLTGNAVMVQHAAGEGGQGTLTVLMRDAGALFKLQGLIDRQECCS